ncbi:hypothetical protein J7E73_23660 [Paenibacillus albidus]|uniref:hypothetical protein n=1 Tax=Paenibacillus albidus TaxID=2041023 RepID=UPI001BE6AE5E|nr:hypothetical protein [Paenibacillus albidus]MBT2292075.1 hypothetical protein [Paenibacillus albidus]
MQENVKALFTGIEVAEKHEEQERHGNDLAELGGTSAIHSEKLEEPTVALDTRLVGKPTG